MELCILFQTGQREISPAATEALSRLQINPDTMFARHTSGDWGESADWLKGDNRNAARMESHSHAIRSLYRLHDLEFWVVTARDRSRTRLMLASEFIPCEVSVQEGYAAWAKSYDLLNPLVAVEEPVVDALLLTLPPVSSAIDVGTGTGRLARKLARRGVQEILGIDATPEMLEVARAACQSEGWHHLRFEIGELGKTPLPVADTSVDLLTCGLMLCHVPSLREAIHECAQVVRPGGWLLLTDFHPSTASFGWRTDYVSTEGHYLLPNTPNTREDYLDALTESGCLILDAQDIALDGGPYGDLSEAAMNAKGWPPLCLVILAQKAA